MDDTLYYSYFLFRKIPSSSASAAIVALNGLMISHIASIMGVKISYEYVWLSIGKSAGLNIGKELFIDLAKRLGLSKDGTYPWFLIGGVIVVFQTFIIGVIAIEIERNGNLLPNKLIIDNTIDKINTDNEGRI